MTADAERLAAIREGSEAIERMADQVVNTAGMIVLDVSDAETYQKAAGRAHADVAAARSLVEEIERLTAERDALRARIEAVTAEAQELTRQGYPMGVMLRILAGDQPEAEESDLPNGHTPIEELSPFLRRRIQPEATPEPPHLDPEPYVDQWGSQRSPDGDSAGYDFDTVFHFEPREGYSKNREDYLGRG